MAYEEILTVNSSIQSKRTTKTTANSSTEVLKDGELLIVRDGNNPPNLRAGDGATQIKNLKDMVPGVASTSTAGLMSASDKTKLDGMSASSVGAVGYNTPQSLTDAQKQQARDNINASAPYEAGDNISITGGIITTKAFPCNPNLLDNWYFGNPVNQRGQTSYTNKTGYCIDRWIIAGDNPQLTVTSGSIKGVGYLVQRAEVYTSSSFEGMQLTLSALMSDNTFGSVTFHLIKGMESPYAIDSNGYIVYVEWQNTNDFFTVNWKTDSKAIGLVAIKLELGSQQTLAHQENGAWVLNEIPDYGEQLLKCQRYLRPAPLNFIVSNSNGNYYASAIMQSPYPMRTVPAIVNSDYTAQPIREVTGGQTATVSQVFTPSVYGGLTIQLTPAGSFVPNYVYIDAMGFKPLLSAEL